MRLTLLSLAIATTASAFSQTFVSASDFRPVPGERELSGFLIARPAQATDLANRGLSPAQAYQATEKARRAVAPYTVRYYAETDEYILKVPNGQTEAGIAGRLLKAGPFDYVQPDWTVFPTATPNDPQLNTQWHHSKVQSFSGWDLFTGSNTPIIVAITDTGIRQTHEDFAGRLVSGANTANGVVTAQSSGGLVEDINGHGTHCAGIAAASGNNGLGVSGMGWGMKIMPIRVTNSSGGSASTSALSAGARWAADNGARVVSTSYSGVNSATHQTTGAYLRSKNVLYLFAAGNSNTNLSNFDYADVTIVGATDSNDAKASFSSYGLATDIYAPGVNIYATIRTNNSSYGFMSGTSMATPLAAGIATMITASNSSLNSNQVQDALYFSCDDLGPVGNDTQWGWGRVNLNKALRYAYNNFPFPAAALTVDKGSSLGDPLSAMNTSDNTYFRASSNEWVSVTLRFDSTLLQVGSMQLVLEDKVSAPGGTICTISSGVSGQKLDSRMIGSTDTPRTINIPVSAIEAGTGDVVLTFTYMPFSRTLPTWQASIDQAVLFTKPTP